MPVARKPLRKIILSGEMGKRFGRVHHAALDTDTPAEAVRYLLSQFPTSRAYLMGAKDRGVGFAVFRGKENIKEDQLREPVGGDVIRFAPVIMGSKNGGILNIIVGAVLIVAGIVVTGMSFGSAAPVGGAMIAAGVSLVAGGVIQLLTPVQKGTKNKSVDNEPSYAFNGAVNTQAQGNPVPLLYGRMIVGSAVISAGINAEDYSPKNASIGGGSLGGNFKKTPYDE